MEPAPDRYGGGMVSRSSDDSDVLDEAALQSLVGNGLNLDDIGPLGGRSLLAVHLDGPEQAARLAPLVESMPCVTVAVAARPFPDPSGFDLYLCDDTRADWPWIPCRPGTQDVLGELSVATTAHPEASLVLVQLLRLGTGLTIADALVAESLAYATLQSGHDHRSWLERRWKDKTRPTHPVPSDDPVLIDRHGAVATITLNRPEVRNAFSSAMRDALIETLRVVVADPSIHQATLQGAGLAFCSGGDLAEFGTASDPLAAHIIRTSQSAGRWINACSDRLIARVHGSCIGAGVELPSFADRVVAAPATRFALPELSMGLVPGAGGTVSIPRRIGRSRAAYLALTGVALEADRALAWGLVDAIDEGASS
jgi:enoyl-CoA hydratase/carnithine racemase